MPFCKNCGKFEVLLNSQNLCSNCSKIENLTEKDILRKNQKISKYINIKNLNYPQNTKNQFMFQIPQNQNQNQNLNQNQNGNRTQGNNHSLNQQAGRFQNSIRNYLFNQLNHPLSSRAFRLCVFGFIMLWIPYLNIISMVLFTMGLVYAIKARRSEPRNWQQIIAIASALIFWILFIIGTIYLMNNPEFLAEMETMAASYN